MATPVVRNRVDSPERWQKALARALEAGIEIFVSASDGQRFATSATLLDTIYAVDAHSCACPAGAAGDPVCQHRAAVRYTLGWLTLEDRSPDTAATVDCGVCHGRGWLYYEVASGR